MYQQVAEHPEGEFHFPHGRRAAELFGYEREWLDRAPPAAVASFAGVGNPHLRRRPHAGEVALDLGSRAGLDSIIAGCPAGRSARAVRSGRNRGATRPKPTAGRPCCSRRRRPRRSDVAVTAPTISTEALRDLLEQGTAVTVLDVRPAAERAEWAIPRSVHVDAYDALRRGDPTALDDFHPPNGRR